MAYGTNQDKGRGLGELGPENPMPYKLWSTRE